jgi:hypothetical protein
MEEKEVNNGWSQYGLRTVTLRIRTAPTIFQWVKGHNGNQGNEEADTLARAGANKPTPDDIQVDIPQNFQTIGAKLPRISQALAYKLIISRNRSDPSRSATINLDITRHVIHELTGAFETDHISKPLISPQCHSEYSAVLYCTVATVNVRHKQLLSFGKIIGF